MMSLAALVAVFDATVPAAWRRGRRGRLGHRRARREQSCDRDTSHQHSRQQVPHTELLSHVLAVPGAQPVFKRNRQLKMPIHMKSTKCQ